MKNYLAFLLGILLVTTVESCVTIQVNPDAVAKEKSYVKDDLYDEDVFVSSKNKKQKSTQYYSSNESDEIIIEEEEGIAQQSKNQTFLNSRSVYSNYDQGYSDGFRNGVFTSNPWNNWYSNPYINFGYSPFRTGITIGWGINNFYSPWGFGNPFSTFGPTFMYQSFGLYNPMLDPFSRYYMPGFAYYPSYYGSFYNPYNYYSYLNSTSGYVNYGNNYANYEQPKTRVIRGPREETGGNRYNEGYTGGSRASSNQYNSGFNNNQQVQQSPTMQQQRNVAQESQRVQQRRNSNVEYSRPSNNYQNNYSRDNYQQNRTNSFGNQSFGNSGSSFSGGGSSGGGGGSYSGGGSRGPR